MAGLILKTGLDKEMCLDSAPRAQHCIDIEYKCWSNNITQELRGYASRNTQLVPNGA